MSTIGIGSAVGAGQHSSSLGAQVLVQEARDRGARPLERREGRGETVAALVFLLIAAPLPFLLDSPLSFNPLTALALVAAFVIASRIKFEVGAGYTNPT